MIDTSAAKKDIKHFHTISDMCKAMQIPAPKHPLIVLVEHDRITPRAEVRYIVHDFYMISYKSNLKGKLKYGQGYYDFDEGGLVFVAPHQALSIEADDECKGFSLFIHPDLLAGSALANSIQKREFFDYNINEALHLSEKERDKVLQIFDEIREELDTTIDETSQALIVSYIEVILNYSNRFYKRQFITRKAVNNPILARFEAILNDYYSTDKAMHSGMPSVKYFSDLLHVSSGYLSDLLRSLTGMNTQQHIHAKVIDLAKQMLTTSERTVAEIAYALGFEYPQSLNKLFKSKTGTTPLDFREEVQPNR